MTDGDSTREPGPRPEMTAHGDDSEARRRKRKRRTSQRARRVTAEAGVAGDGPVPAATAPAEDGGDATRKRRRRRRRADGPAAPEARGNGDRSARGPAERGERGLAERGERGPAERGTAAERGVAGPRDSDPAGGDDGNDPRRARRRRRTRRRGLRPDGADPAVAAGTDASPEARSAAASSPEARSAEGLSGGAPDTATAPMDGMAAVATADAGERLPAAPDAAPEPAEDIHFDLDALDASEDILSEEPPGDDPDPVTFGLERTEVDERRPLDAEVQSVVGIKFAPAGRIYLYDGGDQHHARGQEVVVESDRGLRIGVVAVTSVRRAPAERGLRRVLRPASREDHRVLADSRERSQGALLAARQVARELSLPIKIFRVEHTHSGKKARVYFTSEERIDFRELVRQLTGALRSRVEMRQIGVRDEAKMVGGIGSCGLELCCTTWLPEFVPVSIKMAKDQGLVLNPAKVSGQCGRLKCCLVYEQATYAEMRKGLPKLGKRVITAAGDGRVVEVDVLRQRVRVSLGPGEFQVFAGHEVKPMFPPQAQKKPRS